MPGMLHAAEQQRQIDGQRHGEELIHHSERHAMAALQPATECDRNDIDEWNGDGLDSERIGTGQSEIHGRGV